MTISTLRNGIVGLNNLRTDNFINKRNQLNSQSKLVNAFLRDQQISKNNL